jgi:hypothetical protein
LAAASSFVAWGISACQTPWQRGQLTCHLLACRLAISAS